MARVPQARRPTTAVRAPDTDGAVDLARDRQLVEAFQAGDETAFAELYSRYHRRLLRFCFRRLHVADDAEEAVQEAFTRAWKALPRFGGDRRFYPWLTVIAGNVCTDMLRRRSRVVPLDEMAVQAGGGAALEPDVDEHLLRQIDLTMATEALGHLSDRHQRVLRLRETTEWTSQRIAEHEGVAVPAVDVLLWRARQAFRREFAALSDAGGLAAVLGLGLTAFRRVASRAGARVAQLASIPTRSPGALVATLAITGAAVAGGGAAIINTASHPAGPVATALSTPAASTTSAGSSAGSGRSAPDGAPVGHQRAQPAGGASAGGALAGGVRASSGLGPSAVTGASAPGPAGSVSGSVVGAGAGPVAGLGGYPAAGLGTAVAGAVGSAVGSASRIVGTSTNAVAATLGLRHATPSGPPLGGTVGGTAGGSTSAGTPGGATGTVTTAVPGTAGTVTTAVSGVAGGLGAAPGAVGHSLLGTTGAG